MTKQIKRDTVPPAAADGPPWVVRLHREVGKDVTDYGLSNPDFSPTLRELIEALEANPKQFPKKKGKLKNARAVDVKYRNVAFRAVFVIDEAARIVKVLSLEAHDVAYTRATKRIRNA